VPEAHYVRESAARATGFCARCGCPVVSVFGVRCLILSSLIRLPVASLTSAAGSLCCSLLQMPYELSLTSLHARMASAYTPCGFATTSMAYASLIPCGYIRRCQPPSPVQRRGAGAGCSPHSYATPAHPLCPAIGDVGRAWLFTRPSRLARPHHVPCYHAYSYFTTRCSNIVLPRVLTGPEQLVFELPELDALLAWTRALLGLAASPRLPLRLLCWLRSMRTIRLIACCYRTLSCACCRGWLVWGLLGAGSAAILRAFASVGLPGGVEGA
jgi:hypothetical protein